MKDFNSNKDGKRPSASFVVGAVALLFLIVGYQAALFIHKASVARIIANHDEPDTVFVYAPGNASQATGISADERQDASASSASEQSSGNNPPVTEPAEAMYPPNNHPVTEPVVRQSSPTIEATSRYRKRASGVPNTSGKTFGTENKALVYKKGSGSVNNSFRRNSEHSPQAEQIRRNYTPRKYESFRFDPNTVSIDDLMRLGFTRKQAQSIDNYRQKGGRFRRKSDFAKSYVVEDSVFRRLERYIDIPKIDINSADSVTFMSLPGIGKFFAGKMVSYRKELGGYSYPEQLMDIWHFDQEKFDNLKDLIKLDTVATPPYSLWTLPEKDLASHPYIGKRAARSIVIFKENSPKSDWTVTNLLKAGILPPDKAAKLARCRIAKP